MGWFSGLFRKADAEEEESGIGEPEIAAPMSLGARRKSMLPRFRGTATDQVRSGMRGTDRTRMRLRSAFTPSRPVMDGAMFAGRSTVLSWLIRSIEDQHLHVVIFGPRGIGKTSTLHILCGIAQEARYVVRYISCGERTELDELFRAILKDIPLLYHENYDPTSDEIEEGLSFADLISDAPLTVAQLSDVLAKVSGTRLLIVLDEFDRAHSAEFRRSIAELIKNLSDRGSRVQLVIAGVAQNLNEIIEHIPSIRRNVLGLQLPNMTDQEITDLITNGESASGIEFDKETLRLICSVALGLPYLASLIGQHAGLAALDRDSSKVTRPDADKAIKQSLEEIELRIAPSSRHQIERAFADQRGKELGLLARIALQNSGRLVPAAVEAALTLPMSVDGYLAKLNEDYGLVKPIPDDPGGVYGFSDDGVPIYLWIRLTQDHVLQAI